MSLFKIFSKKSIKKFRIGIIATTAAYFLLLPSFYEIYKPLNRYDMFWNWSLVAGIILAIMGVAGIGIGVYCILLSTRRKGLQVLASWIEYSAILGFLLVFERFLLSLFMSQKWRLSPLIPHLYIYIENNVLLSVSFVVLLTAVVVYAYRQATKTVVGNLYTVLSLLLLGLVFMLFTSTKYLSSGPTLRDSIAAKEVHSSNTGNIYVFLFDEWSYLRTFSSTGLAKADFPHLRAFQATATSYSQAYSPWAATRYTLLSMLFGNDEQFLDSTWSQREKNLYTCSKASQSTLSIFRDTHFTVCVGWGAMNFYDSLNHLVDYCFSAPGVGVNVNPKNNSFSIALFYWKSLFKVPPMISAANSLHSVAYNTAQRNRTLEIHEMITQNINDVIEQVHLPTVAFFHCYPPHSPWVFSKTGYKDIHLGRETPLDYMDNLDFVDVTIGTIISKLKAAHLYENSTIVFLSDHTFRVDPIHLYGPEKAANMEGQPLPSFHDLPEGYQEQLDFRRVPLLIKWAHQSVASNCFDRMDTGNLFPFLQDTLTAPK